MNNFTTYSLNLPGGRLVTIDRPWVMGIINATPDSFHAPSRALEPHDVEQRVAEMVAAGVDVIDIGACSTRPGSTPPPPAEELARLRVALPAARRAAAATPISVDTYRSDVARAAVLDLGADIINDIGGGTLDNRMFDTIAALRVPYVLSHTRGTPATMQSMTDYGTDGVVAAVTEWLMRRADDLRQRGVCDIIADPGFGFAKQPSQCYQLMAALGDMTAALDMPVMVGISRKAMVKSITGDTLTGTTVLNTLALAAGVHIIRVHDVPQALIARDIVHATRCATPPLNKIHSFAATVAHDMPPGAATVHRNLQNPQ